MMLHANGSSLLHSVNRFSQKLTGTMQISNKTWTRPRYGDGEMCRLLQADGANFTSDLICFLRDIPKGWAICNVSLSSID